MIPVSPHKPLCDPNIPQLNLSAGLESKNALIRGQARYSMASQNDVPINHDRDTVTGNVLATIPLKVVRLSTLLNDLIDLIGMRQRFFLNQRIYVMARSPRQTTHSTLRVGYLDDGSFLALCSYTLMTGDVYASERE